MPSCKFTLNEVERKLNSLYRLRENYEKKFQMQLSFIKKHCPHKRNDGQTTFEYSPDPSGNNDTYYKCTYCGMIKKRLDE